MAQTLEAIRGGGGSVKVGTTGTISALISRELESIKSNPSSSCTSTSVLKPDTSEDESSSTYKNLKVPENTRTKNHTRNTHQIPILTPDNTSTDGTPIRQKKTSKKGVEIVDIKCQNSNIALRLKKLRFSKMSDSVV